MRPIYSHTNVGNCNANPSTHYPTHAQQHAATNIYSRSDQDTSTDSDANT